MKILSSKKKEVIEVLHNNLGEMPKNIEKLKSEGWSDNFWNSYTRNIPKSEVNIFKKENPTVEVYIPSKGSLLHSLPYVYVTNHEREIISTKFE